MAKGKSDRKFVNLSEEHELSGFLNRRGYKGNQEARDKLIDTVTKMKGDNTSQNIEWKELDVEFKKVSNKFDKTK